MLLSPSHIRFVRIFLASLVIVASSGATVLLHRCQMEAASCCAPNLPSEQDGCEEPVAAQSGPVFKSDFTCHVNVIVGGLALKQALLEKGNKQSSDVGVVVQVATFFLRGLVRSENPSYAFFAARTVSPPSVEKYVLFDSFLI